MTAHGSLSADQRERLAAFADCLIVGGSGLPSASASGLQGVWIDRVFAARPDIGELVVEILGESGSPQDVLARLRERDHPKFTTFAFAIAGTYLINPRIRELLGFPGPIPMKSPAFPDEAQSYLEDGLLDVVIERGPIYRATPLAKA